MHLSGRRTVRRLWITAAAMVGMWMLLATWAAH
jgi:hypothetical protein